MQPRTALKPILILRKALQPKTEKNLICSGVYRGPAAKSAPDCAGGQGHSRRPGQRLGSEWRWRRRGRRLTPVGAGANLSTDPMVKTLAYTVNNPEA